MPRTTYFLSKNGDDPTTEVTSGLEISSKW